MIVRNEDIEKHKRSLWALFRQNRQDAADLISHMAQVLAHHDADRRNSQEIIGEFIKADRVRAREAAKQAA